MSMSFSAMLLCTAIYVGGASENLGPNLTNGNASLIRAQMPNSVRACRTVWNNTNNTKDAQHLNNVGPQLEH